MGRYTTLRHSYTSYRTTRSLFCSHILNSLYREMYTVYFHLLSTSFSVHFTGEMCFPKWPFLCVCPHSRFFFTIASHIVPQITSTELHTSRSGGTKNESFIIVTMLAIIESLIRATRDKRHFICHHVCLDLCSPGDNFLEILPNPTPSHFLYFFWEFLFVCQIARIHIEPYLNGIVCVQQTTKRNYIKLAIYRDSSRYTRNSSTEECSTKILMFSWLGRIVKYLHFAPSNYWPCKITRNTLQTTH